MRKLFLLSLGLSLMPGLAQACACGCGVFDVQTGSMFPEGQGGQAWLEYDFMDQNKNWSGTSSAPAANNSDKTIRTDFFTLGGQYMFDRSWGVMAEVPYWHRYFNTEEDNGDITSFTHSALGDVRLEGIYSGFSADMSTGIRFGVKLPTGDFEYAGFDRDTEIGTGSTDMLLGAYHLGRFTSSNWDWFVNGTWDQPVLISDGYRPGSEFDAVGGVYYNGITLAGVRITPIAQVITSYRLSDRGPASNPDDSGYKRVLLSPGLELGLNGWKADTNVDFPVYQQMIGNQLTAPVLLKFTVSHSF